MGIGHYKGVPPCCETATSVPTTPYVSAGQRYPEMLVNTIVFNVYGILMWWKIKSDIKTQEEIEQGERKVLDGCSKAEMEWKTMGTLEQLEASTCKNYIALEDFETIPGLRIPQNITEQQEMEVLWTSGLNLSTESIGRTSCSQESEKWDSESIERKTPYPLSPLNPLRSKRFTKKEPKAPSWKRFAKKAPKRPLCISLLRRSCGDNQSDLWRVEGNSYAWNNDDLIVPKGRVTVRVTIQYMLIFLALLPQPHHTTMIKLCKSLA